MKLKLKTNRNDFIIWWIPIIVIIAIILIIVLVDVYGLNNEKTASSNGLIIFCSLFLCVAIIIILTVKFFDRKTFFFSNEKIEVFKWKKKTDEIMVDEIVSIRYVRFNGKYISKLIHGDSVLDGNACQMYVGLKNGNLLVLGSLSTRDAKKIKKLYGDLVQII